MEMLFPKPEYPPPDVVAALSEWGVTSRALPTAVGDKLANLLKGTGHKTQEAALCGFTLKIAAVILSSFREVHIEFVLLFPVAMFMQCDALNLVRRQVLFLDSDNVVVSDPDFLFNTPEYKQYGAMLWPDYWESSAAPDVQAILGINGLPVGTTESGQMLFDKAR